MKGSAGMKSHLPRLPLWVCRLGMVALLVVGSWVLVALIAWTGWQAIR